MKRIFCAFIAVVLTFMTGCFSLNVKSSDKNSNSTSETIIIPSSENVYRTSENITIKVKVQNKDGEWVDLKNKVLIPTGWYIVSGVGIE